MLATVKYWVYKDSRILGPFDKDGVAGVPGLDASTLVCAGESAAAGEGDWRPAGDVVDLSALPPDRGVPWSCSDFPTTFGLIDKLQIEAAGLIGDADFPGAAEDLFQDADMKRAFGDLLAPRPSVDEAELRRAKDRAAEMTIQLELLYKRVAELETGQTNLVHRLAEKEMELRTRLEAPPAASPFAPPSEPANASVTTSQLELVLKRMAEMNAGHADLVRLLAEKEAQLAQLRGRPVDSSAPPPTSSSEPLPPAPPSDRLLVAEMSAQVDLLRKRVAELNAGHADLADRLAEKELQLRGRSIEAPVPPPPAAPAAASDRPSVVELTAQIDFLHKRLEEMDAAHSDLVRRVAEKELQLRSRSAGASSAVPAGPDQPSVAELTAQVELLHKRMTEMDAAHVDLARRLAEKELQLRSRSADASAPVPAASDRPMAAELTAHIELLHRRVAELKSGHADLADRLAEKELQLRSRPVEASVPPPAAPPEPASTPAPDLSAPEPETPPIPPLARRAPEPEPAESLPKEDDLEKKAVNIFPAAKAFRVVGPEDDPAAGAIPALPQSADASEFQPKKSLFETKTFKIIPTTKAFPVAGADAGVAAPAPEASSSPAEGLLDPAVAPPAPREPVLEAAADPAPITPMPTDSTPPLVVAPPAETAAPPPPLTLSFGSAAPFEPANPPMPEVFNPGRSFADSAVKEEPPMTPPMMDFTGTGDVTGTQSAEDALARLAKPAPAAAEAPRAPRSNKAFLIGAGALVVVMALVGYLFLRHPKDLKQMTELDDGRARVGAEPADEASRPPIAMPKPAVPPAEAAGAAATQASSGAAAPGATQAASQAKLDAAVAAVKDFPLDGERGTVAQWLQYSYSAGPDAGKESWRASETADKTYLVEYRFAPSTRGAEVSYLFEVDMDRGFVIGKNLDAKSVLAGGGPPVVAEKPKAKQRKPAARSKKKTATSHAAVRRAAKTAARTVAKRAAKRSAKRTADDITPREVPLLPLPNEGELRPPAEDDGAFTADTVNSGL